MKTPGRILFESTWQTMAWWLVAALALALSGYPGGLLISPLTALQGFFAGMQAYRSCGLNQIHKPVWFALLAGSITGFGNGVITLLAACLSAMLPWGDGYQTPLFFVLLVVVDTLIGAVLGLFAGLVEMRRNGSMPM